MDRVELDDVLRRACRRDPEALSTLVDVYSPRVFGLLHRLSGSREAAEDLMQETFLRMVRTIEQYEHSGKFEAWLFRIAVNLVRDHARQSRRRGETVPLNPDDGAAEAAAAHGPERQVTQAEARQRLERCFERLSEPEREILALRYFAGLPFAEIAGLLGVPLGTALARAHRALQRLKTEFGEMT